MISGMPARDVGIRIRKRRQALRLTQEQLAVKLGVAVSTVANWESGRHFPQRYEGAIEDVLGITLTDDSGMPGLPPIVDRYSYIQQVMTLWEIPEAEMPEPTRLALIRKWLELNPPAPDDEDADLRRRGA